jgi:hypothetical protein
VSGKRSVSLCLFTVFLFPLAKCSSKESITSTSTSAIEKDGDVQLTLTLTLPYPQQESHRCGNSARLMRNPGPRQTHSTPQRAPQSLSQRGSRNAKSFAQHRLGQT